ncbi:ESPR-type extended signal peptide-containing protein [Escherichia coli]|nr:ESPR-type extended signal peptide-containing protein [Escherichia coli]
MNRIYRVIWNCTLQVFQACSELTRRAGKTSTVNLGNDSNLLIVFYVQIMPDDFVMQLHRF